MSFGSPPAWFPAVPGGSAHVAVSGPAAHATLGPRLELRSGAVTARGGKGGPSSQERWKTAVAIFFSQN